MKKSELKELIKEIIQEEHQNLKEVDTPSLVTGGIIGYVLKTVKDALTHGSQSISQDVHNIKKNPKILSAQRNLVNASVELAKSLEELPGDTEEEKLRSSREKLSQMNYTFPTTVRGKRKK